MGTRNRTKELILYLTRMFEKVLSQFQLRLMPKAAEVDMQTIPISSTATVGSTISYTVIKGKNGKNGFTPSMSRKASASASAPKSSGSSGGGGGGKAKN